MKNKFDTPWRTILPLLIAAVFLLAPFAHGQSLPITVAPTNIPLVSITLCTAGTNDCQTINNLILDTGSVGIRILSSALQIKLDYGAAIAAIIAECQPFGSGNAWGPIESATVTMGSEPAVTVPIQVVGATVNSSAPPAPCNSMSLANFLSDYGVNGILGIAPSQFDDGYYFSCPFEQGGVGTCTQISQNGEAGVQNPVYLLPTDNNGVFISMPEIAETGGFGAYGTLTFGIGTNSTNSPAQVGAYQVNVINASSLGFTTNYISPLAPSGTPSTPLSQSLIDTGSEFLFFEDFLIPQCEPTLALALEGLGAYCPTSYLPIAETLSGQGATQTPIEFNLGNAGFLLSDLNFMNMDVAFNDVGVFNPSIGSDTFDWGFPFFYGRVVFIAYGQTLFGSPPMWGFGLLL